MTRFIVNAPCDDLQSRETMLRNLDRDRHHEQRLDSIIRELRTAAALMNGLGGNDFVVLGALIGDALAKSESMKG
jgi:hypothetical protein